MQQSETKAAGTGVYTRSVLEGIRRVLEREHDLREIIIRPMGADAARLSIPLRIYAVDGEGRRVRVFGKLIGSTEPLLERSMQFAKNLFLQRNSQDPIFGIGGSTQDLADHQFRLMGAIHGAGVPTARPLGCHDLGGGHYLLVTEYLDATPITKARIGPDVMDQAFHHLSVMHQNKLYHGDIKPENILIGDKVYILDVGRFRDDVPGKSKGAYDLACMICSFLGSAHPELICKVATDHFTHGQLRSAVGYLDLVQRRPDIQCSDETKARLRELLGRRRLFRTGNRGTGEPGNR